MAENVRVVVRFRPFHKNETRVKNTKKFYIETTKNGDEIVIPNIDSSKEKSFLFDSIFQNVNQEIIFDEIGFNLCDDILLGYNGTIFCYGQKGCGKTYSLLGISNNELSFGIIPRSISYILIKIKESSKITESSIFLSFLQIKNKNMIDLLNINNKNIKIGLNKKQETVVFNLTEYKICNIIDLLKLIEIINKNENQESHLLIIMN